MMTEYFSDAVRRDLLVWRVLNRPHGTLMRKVKEQYAHCSSAEKPAPVEKETQRK